MTTNNVYCCNLSGLCGLLAVVCCPLPIVKAFNGVNGLKAGGCSKKNNSKQCCILRNQKP